MNNVKSFPPEWDKFDANNPFRPYATDDDAMDFLAETGMVTPITNSKGEILISPSNEIYSL